MFEQKGQGASHGFKSVVCCKIYACKPIWQAAGGGGRSQLGIRVVKFIVNYSSSGLIQMYIGESISL